jgi:N-methylhydantoinase A
MRLAIDMGGTFTDVVLERDDGRVGLFKAPTTPVDPAEGIINGIAAAAADSGLGVGELLAATDVLVHGTTRATNAILTGTQAKTAFLTTAGHPDILLFRLGGRENPFDHSREFPPPYVARSLTYEIDERLDYQGTVVRPLDEGSVYAAVEAMAAAEIEAAGVCLLWSIANPEHELAVGRILTAELPGVAVTLSHRLNPIVREYHRASSACIDASLKPLMTDYLAGLEGRLIAEGFAGRLLVASVSGGLLASSRLAAAPIHSINSGPALAPTAGRHHAQREDDKHTAIVIDAGGTSLDVSVVRRGEIPRTRETWLGAPFISHLTGFPSIDVRTTGSGGGSIARVDAGGLLRVGPESAGAEPGPVCYGRGGAHPTVTDACMVLGYLEPARLEELGVAVDRDAAGTALAEQVGKPLGLDRDAAAAAVVRVVTEQMVYAIEEVTVEQGVDPRTACLVSGGGAAGFNVVRLARRLGCETVIVPLTSSALSATGGLISPIFDERAAAIQASSDEFPFELVNGVLERLGDECRAGLRAADVGSGEVTVDLIAEARYPGQVWELELPLQGPHFEGADDVAEMVEDFHRAHEEVFAVRDARSPIEIIGLRARIRTGGGTVAGSILPSEEFEVETRGMRRAFFESSGWCDAPVVGSAHVGRVAGPAILELPGTSIVLDPGAVAERGPGGSILITPNGDEKAAAAAAEEVLDESVR